MALLDNILKTKRERTLFYVTMSVIGGALLLTWVILPGVDRWVTTSNKLSKKKVELREVNDLLKNEKKINEEFEKYQKGIQVKDPQKRPEDVLLLQASEIQKETGIRFTRMDPVVIKKIPKMPGYQSYSLQAVFESDLITMSRFLESLQIRGLYIDYLQISPKSKAPHNPTLQVTVRMAKVVSKEEEKKNNIGIEYE